jgi:hypothetical protein
MIGMRSAYLHAEHMSTSQAIDFLAMPNAEEETIVFDLAAEPVIAHAVFPEPPQQTTLLQHAHQTRIEKAAVAFPLLFSRIEDRPKYFRTVMERTAMGIEALKLSPT